MRLVLLVFAFVCFVLAAVTPAFKVDSKINLTAAGLAFLTASMIFA
jgi:hypothetical protein